MAGRWVIHADMDAFYASVEQRDDPSLRGKPVIVGASSERGVVSAASYEARRFGVRSAMPGFRARQLCPQGIYLAGNMEKYSNVSRQIRAIFEEFTDAVEPLALDEAFLDVTGSIGLFGSAEKIARRIKERVKEETDLVVSVGVAPNKLVAKIACSLGKPDGLKVVGPNEVAALLAPLPVRALFGIGPKAEQRLHQAGLTTLGQLARADESRLYSLLGSQGPELKKRASGQDDRPVERSRVPQSIGEEATFPDDVSDQDRVSGAITSHAERVAERARRAGYVGRTVILKIKLAQRRAPQGGQQVAPHELYRIVSRQLRLSAATADATVIRQAGLQLWQRLALGEPIRLLGLTLSALQRDEQTRQLDLFAPRLSGVGPEDEIETAGREARGERLGRTLDAIADKFGAGKVRRAVDVPEKITASDRAKIGEEK